MRFCVVNKKTGRVSRCFASNVKARAFCARLNRLNRRTFTVQRKR